MVPGESYGVLTRGRLLVRVPEKVSTFPPWSLGLLFVVAIKRRLDGIMQKALTRSLRRLERNGIVVRRVITASPVAVEYRITPWTVDYLPEIERARQEYDRRAGN